ncbi:hypothetical protein BHM03_00048138 [Ensete ventricosum]|nr:hypothetical protein BHM03_00048138 [Ensete ventricosum]
MQLKALEINMDGRHSKLHPPPPPLDANLFDLLRNKGEQEGAPLPTVLKGRTNEFSLTPMLTFLSLTATATAQQTSRGENVARCHAHVCRSVCDGDGHGAAGSGDRDITYTHIAVSSSPACFVAAECQRQ